MRVVSVQTRIVRKLLCVSTALVLVAIPFGITLNGWAPEISLHSAFAKDGGGKGGSGNGNGGGNGKGEGGGKGNSGGGGGGNSGGGKSGGTGSATSQGSAGRKAASGAKHVNPRTGDLVQVSGNNIAVLHRNGMREAIRAGRYRMTDGKGRTIIERAATRADVSRLRGMAD
jgi:hypothetical protein